MNVILDISHKRWMDESEAVVYTTLSRETLREKRDDGKLPFRKYGRKIIYDRNHLDQLIENLEYHVNGRIHKAKTMLKIV